MKNTVLISVIFLCLSLCSCKTKKNNITETKDSTFEDFLNQYSISEKSLSNQSDKSWTIEEDLVLVENHQNNYEPVFEIKESDFFGTTALVSVNSDDTNVYVQPTSSSKIIGKLQKGDIVRVCGFSKSDVIKYNREEHFIKINLNKDFPEYYHDNYTCIAWIRISDTDIDNSITVNEFVFSDSEVCMKRNNVISKITFEIIDNGYKNLPIFIWCSCSKDFMYNDPVGIFAIDYSNEKIIHISDIGCIEESAWSLVTDDQRVVLEDFGTNFGLRGLKIFDIETSKIIYSGLYLGTFGGLQKENSNITVVERYSEWDIQQNMISKESIDKVEQYKKNIAEDDLYSSEIIVLYRLNLDSLEKTFMHCSLIPEI